MSKNVNNIIALAFIAHTSTGSKTPTKLEFGARTLTCKDAQEFLSAHGIEITKTSLYDAKNVREYLIEDFTYALNNQYRINAKYWHIRLKRI